MLANRMTAGCLLCCLTSLGCVQTANTDRAAAPAEPAQHAELMLTLRKLPDPADPDEPRDVFGLELTNVGKEPIVLDRRMLARPGLLATVLSGRSKVLPQWGIPPTPRTTRSADLYPLGPGRTLKLRFALADVVPLPLKPIKHLIFCYIHGGYSPFSPSGRMPETWQGTAYSNSLVFVPGPHKGPQTTKLYWPR